MENEVKKKKAGKIVAIVLGGIVANAAGLSVTVGIPCAVVANVFQSINNKSKEWKEFVTNAHFETEDKILSFDMDENGDCSNGIFIVNGTSTSIDVTIYRYSTFFDARTCKFYVDEIGTSNNEQLFGQFGFYETTIDYNNNTLTVSSLADSSSYDSSFIELLGSISEGFVLNRTSLVSE